jgi:hypothetical protein
MTKLASVLVVAESTVAADTLVEAIRAQAGDGPAYFNLVVSAVDGPETVALGRLDRAITRMRAHGLCVSGRVTRLEPLSAIDEALETSAFDRVIRVASEPQRDTLRPQPANR